MHAAPAVRDESSFEPFEIEIQTSRDRRDDELAAIVDLLLAHGPKVAPPLMPKFAEESRNRRATQVGTSARRFVAVWLRPPAVVRFDAGFEYRQVQRVKLQLDVRRTNPEPALNVS